MSKILPITGSTDGIGGQLHRQPRRAIPSAERHGARSRARRSGAPAMLIAKRAACSGGGMQTRASAIVVAAVVAGCASQQPPVDSPLPPAAEAPPAAPQDSETSAPKAEPAAKDVKIVLASDVEWQALNPARGDASPMAATLWGDRNGTVATGFLFKPVDGFESPPHIHNVSYRGVVISGVVHNDDAAAERMWMPAGSFWTQPKGAPHITAAKGTDTRAYIEIDSGPYLVRPVADAFDSGERPINVHASNIVWVDATSASGQSSATPATKSPQIAFLWGKPADDQRSGFLVKLRAGSSAALRSRGVLRAVVIEGHPAYQGLGGAKPMTPGSYLSSAGGSHDVSCAAGAACVLYVHAEGRLAVVPTP